MKPFDCAQDRLRGIQDVGWGAPRISPGYGCVPCVGAILVIALGGRGQGEYKIRPYQETEDTSE